MTDRSGQVWLATPWGSTRAASGETTSFVHGPDDELAHPCLIVEPSQPHAAHVSHSAVDLVTGERCRLLEELVHGWEELIRTLHKEGAAHMAPVRIT